MDDYSMICYKSMDENSKIKTGKKCKGDTCSMHIFDKGENKTVCTGGYGRQRDGMYLSDAAQRRRKKKYDKDNKIN